MRIDWWIFVYLFRETQSVAWLNTPKPAPFLKVCTAPFDIQGYKGLNQRQTTKTEIGQNCVAASYRQVLPDLRPWASKAFTMSTLCSTIVWKRMSKPALRMTRVERDPAATRTSSGILRKGIFGSV